MMEIVDKQMYGVAKTCSKDIFTTFDKLRAWLQAHRHTRTLISVNTILACAL